ncbi:MULTISPECIES: cardiolipin synthase [Enterococcus]|uniref:cardiolipin synthase n=1 Tax=Enterococcus TaxID=1350 RepID=UPI00065DD9E7|nr:MULTISPECIES: cardiolipin synthase [Enterococcus]KAF1302481.1 cardiolipin synthase [Enterococcus sp. JM9B]
MTIEMDMSIINWVIAGLLLVNTLGAIVTVFRKPRSITSVLAWLLTLVFFPVIGFLVYLFCGRGIDGETVYRFNQEHRSRIKEINQLIHQNNKKYHRTVKTSGSELLERYLRNVEESPLAKGNDLSFYTDGKEKFAALFADIKQAKDNVHVEYYAFFDDQIGNDFLNLLVEKAKEGVEVRVIFDPWGAKGSSPKFFDPLVAAGGKVTPFITSRDLIRKTRLNYHLHRKIVVIDGRIAWTGGFNVGDQYLSRSEKFGYWRDTHGRIVGTASFSLQEIFIKDWNASVQEDDDQLEYEDRYFVLPETEGNVSMQIVSDGPETEEEILKSGFVKMILAAEEKIWIQTPYLIPDDTMINALLVAVRSGVDVRIMIPDMPDHAFIFRATQHYANYLHKRGVKIYSYNNGFLHAKTILMDDLISSFGSTNQDIRSYSLNFEVSAFVYDEEITKQMQEIFEKDRMNCTLLTDEIIENQSWWLRFKQNFSRLLSPIL